MIISFILLCYNQPKQISKAINSILFSRIPKDKYEIIIVDDGSNDNSVDVVNEFTKENKNIKLIQMNENTRNQSLCRNTAIRKAYGEYVAFIDGDDYVNTNEIHKIIKYIEEDKCTQDIYQVSRLNKRVKDGRTNKYNNTESDYNFTSEPPNSFFTIGICCYIVKLKYIVNNDLYFDEDKYTWYLEDVVFSCRIYDNTKKIKPIDTISWYYCCIKYPVSNSIIEFENYSDKIWFLGYLSDMKQYIDIEIKNTDIKNIANGLLEQTCMDLF